LILVPEGRPGRFVHDAVRYNTAPKEVLQQEYLSIDDLYAFAPVGLDDCIIAPGNVHKMPSASAAQGRQGSRAIAKYLDK
jgi:hypothetical protein